MTAAITPPTAIAVSLRLTIDIASAPLFERKVLRRLLVLKDPELMMPGVLVALVEAGKSTTLTRICSSRRPGQWSRSLWR